MNFSSRIFGLGLLALASVVAACSVSDASNSGAFGGMNDTDPTIGGDAGGINTGGGGGGADAATPATNKVGNALCNATVSTTCIPDGENDSASRCDVSYGGAAPGGSSGGTGSDGLGPDGIEDGGVTGTPDAGVGSSFACHVTLADAGAPTPECLPAGWGLNGASCKTSLDCASGFECVGNANAPGICRQYCCVNACDDNSFCDVQSEKANQVVKVPVCEPVVHCGLLASPSDCGGDQTCGIVDDDDGTTSCVDIGPAKAGESCDDVHCGRNLTCLGAEGARKCVALCDKAKPNCSASQTCVGSAPLIHDMGVG
ncbi:MAG TPA: hypothetical protein VF407_16900, partial [Polyangiaceae bacterium]